MKKLLAGSAFALAFISTAAFAGQSNGPRPSNGGFSLSFTKSVKYIANSTVTQSGWASKGGAVTQIAIVNQNSPLSLGGLGGPVGGHP